MQLEQSRRFGAIATLAPLCALRDPHWAADLWQAELRAMGVPREPGGPAHRGRRDMATAALSYAEDLALEGFAITGPAVACGRLASDPDMQRADGMVRDYRDGIEQLLW